MLTTFGIWQNRWHRHQWPTGVSIRAEDFAELQSSCHRLEWLVPISGGVNAACSERTMGAAHLEIESQEEMAITVAVLEERVNNHIRLFWKVIAGVIAGGGLWLAVISGELYRMNGTMNRVEQAQANAPAQIVANLLKKPSISQSEAMEKLNAVSTVLRAAKIRDVRPDSQILKEMSSEISRDQDQYPDLPSVWQATSALINYKSDAVLSPSSKTPTVAKGVLCIGEIGRSDGAVFSNCEIDLEDLSRRISKNFINGVEPLPFNFIHCIVHYSGGPIMPGRLSFTDCQFRFDIQGVPVASGIAVVRQLTTEDMSGQFQIST